VAGDLGPSITLVPAPPPAGVPARPRLRRAGAIAARILLVVLGSLAVAVALSVLLAAFLPALGRDARFTIGFLMLVPMWVTGMCLGFLIIK
jgi:hypothetical protein